MQDFTIKDAFLASSWSIMRVSDPVNRAEEASTMSFEDFLEALCRTSDLMSIPTDEDIAEAGCKTAGEWDTKIDVETRSTPPTTHPFLSLALGSCVTLALYACI